MRALRDVVWRGHGGYADFLNRHRGALIVAGGILLCSVIGAGLSTASIEPTQKPEIADVPALPCQQQTWPYISNTCLQADKPASGAPGRAVRQISIDRDSPRTVYLYPEAPKPAPAKAKRSTAPTKADRRAERRPAKRAAPQRQPADNGYQAYGYRPR